MPNINITVREKIAHTISDTCIVCGNSDYVAIFDFDAEWDAYEVKTARFIWGGTFTDVPFAGNECPVPVIPDAVSVLVGVYAGDLHTTTAAAVGVRRSILGGSETEAEVSHEIKDAFGKMLAGKIDAPQVAQVGEVLTVEEVDEDGKPIKWKAAKVSGTFVCTFNDGEDGWITCDKTVEEIITANNDGKDVIGHYYGEIYRLSTPLETGGGYGNPMFSNLGVGVLSIIQYDGGHFEINRIRLSDIAPEDIPNSYEVPVYVPTRDGMQWQYGRPLLATDYVMNELTDEEKALMQKNLGIDALSLVKYTEQELTDEEQVQARKNIRAKPIDFPVTITSTTTDGVTTYTADKTFAEIKAAYDSGANVYALYNEYISYLFYFENSAVWFRNFDAYTDYIAIYINSYNGIDTIEVERLKYLPVVSFETLRDYLNKSYPPIIMSLSDSTAPNGGGVLFYSSGMSSSKINYSLLTNSGELYNIEYDRRYGNISTSKVISPIPSPATAQVGQIVKVKSVDESGKITETATVDMPSQKALKWVTVHSSDLAETKRELIISTDTDGKSIADYNPVGLSLIVSTPADATVESNNGAPWIYPSTTKFDNAIRVIGNISGWKTIARDSAFVFNGGSSAMSCSGNVNTSLPTYKLDGYALDGVRIFFNSANDHLPVGTHVEVAILCEVAE